MPFQNLRRQLGQLPVENGDEPFHMKRSNDPYAIDPTLPPTKFLGRILNKVIGDEAAKDGDSIRESMSPVDFLPVNEMASATARGASSLGKAMVEGAPAHLANEVGSVGKDIEHFKALREKLKPVEIKDATHVSQEYLDKLNDPALVDSSKRYDYGTSSVFGPNTYFGEGLDNDWINTANTSGGIAGDKVHTGDIQLKNALEISPDTISDIPETVLKSILKSGKTNNQGVHVLKNLGSDGIVIRGMDSKNAEFWKALESDETLKNINEKMRNVSKDGRDLSWDSPERRTLNEQLDKLGAEAAARQRAIAQDVIKVPLDRDTLDRLQDQVVSFDPINSVKNFKPLYTRIPENYFQNIKQSLKSGGQ